MKTLILQNQFEKDLKKIKHSGIKNLKRLDEFVKYLVTGEKLENLESYRTHILSGNFKGFYECHIKPDLLLIFQSTEFEVKLVRLGSHSELFD